MLAEVRKVYFLPTSIAAVRGCEVNCRIHCQKFQLLFLQYDIHVWRVQSNHCHSIGDYSCRLANTAITTVLVQMPNLQSSLQSSLIAAFKSKLIYIMGLLYIGLPLCLFYSSVSDSSVSDHTFATKSSFEVKNVFTPESPTFSDYHLVQGWTCLNPSRASADPAEVIGGDSRGRNVAIYHLGSKICHHWLLHSFFSQGITVQMNTFAYTVHTYSTYINKQ